MNQVAERAQNVPDASSAAASPQGCADRQKLALIAVERTHMPMTVSDPNQPDNPVILANQAFLNLTEYSADEVIGRNCRFLQGSGTKAEDIAVIRDAIVADHNVTHELKNYRKDGSEFWNQLHITPIHDDAGKLIYHFASQRDVTDSRKARELELAEHALLKEVDHRAKNALALVQGIVRLSRDDDPKQYAHAVQGRVDSLATAHALLADRHWDRVPLSDLLDKQLVDVPRRRIELHGPAVALEPALVQPLALLLHELIGNAAQHGGLSTPGGSLTIRWHEEPGALALHTIENGGPPTAGAPKPGFGLTIMRAIAVRQLGGELDFDWTPDGLASSIRVPHRPKPGRDGEA